MNARSATVSCAEPRALQLWARLRLYMASNVSKPFVLAGVTITPPVGAG
jgi:hypothetical protein